MTTIGPGSTIGILGGGQLGKMLAVAAAQLGYRCHIYAPDQASVAAQVSASFTCASFHDEDALKTFARECDVVTYEFENVPTAPLGLLAKRVPLRPGAKALEIAQSRVDEKRFAIEHGGRTAPYAFAESASELAGAMDKIGLPSILKTNSMGYDGKGQMRLDDSAEPEAVWTELGERPCVVEGLVDFAYEFSVILVRGTDGETRFWPSSHNMHEDGILSRAVLPPPDAVTAQIEEAQALASRIADALSYVGVLTLEFFATADGPVFNEMAPRVHNSGHWTIEGAVTSQFENHIRAICSLPLGDTQLAATSVEMTNLIGEDIGLAVDLLVDAANHVHHYGKREARAGRKMGHVTRILQR